MLPGINEDAESIGNLPETGRVIFVIKTTAEFREIDATESVSAGVVLGQYWGVGQFKI